MSYDYFAEYPTKYSDWEDCVDEARDMQRYIKKLKAQLAKLEKWKSQAINELKWKDFFTTEAESKAAELEAKLDGHSFAKTERDQAIESRDEARRIAEVLAEKVEELCPRMDDALEWATDKASEACQ